VNKMDVEILKYSEMFGFVRTCQNDPRRKEYNSKFKKQVQELTITCVYDYNTVYRVCSMLGIKKAKEFINTCSDVALEYLFMHFCDFPDKMTVDEEEAARATLKQVDPDLPGLFQSLLESSEYNSETLYRVFMSHGNGAKDIVDYAVENELMPFQLLQYSEKKLSEHAEEAMKNLRNFHKRMSKDGRLPKKFKNGWHV